MLSIFPTMFLSLIAHAILRVCVGLLLVYLGVRHLRTPGRTLVRTQMSLRSPRLAPFFSWYIAFLELVVGALFVVGFITQIAAILSALLSLKMLVMHKRLAPPAFPQSLFYILLLGASVSLFITGAGAFAIDLPF